MEFFLKIVSLVIGIIAALYSGFFSIVAFSEEHGIPVAGADLTMSSQSLTRQSDLYIRKSLFEKGGFPEKLPAGMNDDAIRAFKLDPFSVQAIHGMALDEQLKERLSSNSQLMILSRSMTKRNGVTNTWLLLHYAEQENLSGILDIYDSLLRTNGPGADNMLLAMTDALKNPSFIEPMELVLLADPPWGSRFWQKAQNYAPALENIALLRGKLARQGIRNPADNDDDLLFSLTTLGMIDAARKLHGELGGKAPNGRQFVNNPDFTLPLKKSPFSWTLGADSTFVGNFDLAASRMNIEVYERGIDPYFRQLIRLTPGKYTLSAIVEGDRRDGSLADIQLKCALPGSAITPIKLPISSGDSNTTFTLEGSECTEFWLSVRGTGGALSSSYSFSVDRISIQSQ